MDAPTILTLIGVLLGSNWLGSILLEMYKNKRNDKVEDPMKKLQQQIDELHEVICKLSTSFDKNNEVTMSHARDRLNWLCNRYKEVGFIPEADYVSFKLLGESYIEAGGNHGFDTQFNYVLENYPVK